MKRIHNVTIYSKLSLIYLSVMIFAYLIITLGLYVIMDNYLINQKANVLINQSKKLESIIKDTTANDGLDIKRFSVELASLKRYTGAEAWIMEPDGDIIAADNNAKIVFKETDLSDQEILNITNGALLIKKERIPSLSSDQILLVGYPVLFGPDVKFIIFTYVHVPEIQNTYAGFSAIVVIALILSAVAALIILFVSMKSMRKEFEVINEAAKHIANGNFEKRITNESSKELRELAESFNNMASELFKMESVKRKFISNLSHDLRSPLTSINGYVRAILDGTIDPDKHGKYLNIILEESQRLTKLTNDMLDLTTLQTGNMELTKTEFDINQLILHELDKFETRIFEKNIDVDVDLYEDHVLAFGDLASYTRVIYNLLDNASKFVSEEGKIYIWTRVEDGKIEVGIRNSNPYIPEDKLDYIWMRFSKLDNSRGREKTSSGLGLSIVKEIIRAHEEQIEVASNEQIGVLFIFTVAIHFFKK